MLIFAIFLVLIALTAFITCSIVGGAAKKKAAGNQGRLGMSFVYKGCQVCHACKMDCHDWCARYLDYRASNRRRPRC